MRGIRKEMIVDLRNAPLLLETSKTPAHSEKRASPQFEKQSGLPACSRAVSLFGIPALAVGHSSHAARIVCVGAYGAAAVRISRDVGGERDVIPEHQMTRSMTNAGVLDCPLRILHCVAPRALRR